MNQKDVESIIKAGEISKKVKAYAREIIKKGMPLVEIANKIDEKTFELGGKPAFPISLGIDDVAAHYTPSHDDPTLAQGLLKVDIGIHVNGWTADSAFSIDLEDNEENKKIIEASEKALQNVEDLLKESFKNSKKITTGEIGKTVQETISSFGLNPISNLSGHQIENLELHAGLTIPNVDNGSTNTLEKNSLYAIEPFATNGNGKVYDGKPSGIYALISDKNIRGPIAREVLNHIIENYQTLPFCSRWLVKEFGTKALIGLKQLETNGNLHSYAQLIESGHGKVSQAENTFFISKDGEVIVTTKEKI